MRHTHSLFILLFAAPAFAQSIEVDMNPFGGRVTVTPPAEASVTASRVEEVSGDGFHVRYTESDTGATQLEFVEPQDARAALWDGTRLLLDDDLPTSATVQPAKWYRLRVTRSDGATFERKIQSKLGRIGTVRVFGFAAPAPVAVPVVHASPSAMDAASFERLKGAIDDESFSEQKLDVLRTAAGDAWFTCDQVGQLVELFTFGRDKVAAVEVVRSRLVDRQNAFTLYERFTFSSEKEAVKRLLADR